MANTPNMGDVAVAEPSDATLLNFAALAIAADKLPYGSGVDTFSLADLTAAGRALLDDAAASNQRTTLGLGTIATQDANAVNISGGAIAGITDLPVADGGTGSSTAANARTALGLAIGTDVQPFGLDITAIEALSSAANKVPYATGAQAWALQDFLVGAATSWTPVATFATPGDLSVVYSAQLGRYWRIGNLIFWNCQIQTTTFTYTTASGNFRVTGLPVAAVAGNNQNYGACTMRGWASAGVGSIILGPVGGQTYMETLTGGTAITPTALSTTQIVTTSTVWVFASGFYAV